MPQMTSTIDYKALAKRVAQRAIYADNNADPNNKAWAADLRAVVSLLNGMADAQPVAWRCEVRDLLTQAEQCLSTAVQFAQWAHDEPPSYLSAWDYEADHIAAEIRAMLAAAPAVPQADAQPVAAVPVDWMERLKEAVKHIGYANVEKWYRLGGEDMIEQAKSDAVTAYATLCEALESLYAAPAAPQAEPKRDWSAIDAAIREYLDGYEQIGENDAGADACYTPTERELYLIYDAINGLLADESFVAAISAPQAEPKRTGEVK